MYGLGFMIAPAWFLIATGRFESTVSSLSMQAAFRLQRPVVGTRTQWWPVWQGKSSGHSLMHGTSPFRFALDQYCMPSFNAYSPPPNIPGYAETVEAANASRNI
ncbi:hypothetical protein BCR33DRAFT_172599 [Rhizoclosmatium globosum]|uniref:Secreted protein n=1 Tax=Rhizoclosmatium globosum TaxID=329046 RepID=A0A1Y2CF44_9FUNG|nr:hypothetical protein BCR33DRAFT_172599 [Rhizoclosmatium globosum]|eukprot:ORY45671.1 hypothetical protein BCR33DRAFT_172599 [Rhizoclosmatium globosum]